MTGRRRRVAIAVAATLSATALLSACSSTPVVRGDLTTTSTTATRSQGAVNHFVRKSSGCGVSPAVHGLTKTGPGDVPLTFRSGGMTRTYRLAIPSSYKDNVPAMLILNLHGSGSNAVLASIYSDMPREAANRGAITVTPDAVDGNWQLSEGGSDDTFLVRLVHHITDRYCVNLDSIQVAGFSLGAWKAALEVCAHPTLFASAVLVAVEVHPAGCGPTSVMAFHGTADPVVPYGPGGDPAVHVTGPNADLPGVKVNMRGWAKAGGCSTSKQVKAIGNDVEQWTYPRCDPGVTVVFYSIKGGGHTWPGATITIGPTTHTISATQLALDFFRSHPLRISDQPST